MLNQLDKGLLPILFLILLAIPMLISLILLYSKTPLNLIRIHVGVITLPPLVALIALILNQERIIVGPLYFDSLSWL